jgi:uncharacterized membrane protein
VNPYEAPRAPVYRESPLVPIGILPRARAVPASRGIGWYRDAWRLFTVGPGAWMGVALVFYIIVIALAFIPWVGAFVDTLVLPLFIGGAMLAARRADREREVRVGDLFAALSSHARPLLVIGLPWSAITFVLFLVANAITALHVGLPVDAGILSDDFTSNVLDAAGWLPVVYMNAGFLIVSSPVTLAMWLACALATLNDVPPREALRMAVGGVLRNALPMVLYVLAGVVLAIVASLPALLGWLVLAPMLVATSYVQYRDLFVVADR